MRNKNSSEHPRKVKIGGIEQKVCMAKIRNFAEIAPDLAFTEYDFYEEYRGAFEKTELGRMKKILPLHEMAESFSLVSKRMAPKRGRRSYFTPEGKVALMFLKMKTQMSFPKLMEALNGNVFYQMFCDIVIAPAHPLTNYKLLDDIALELAGKLKIQELQNRLAEAWKPYMKDLDTMFMDATCYESDMRYPTDQKLLWECIEKAYKLMCEESKHLGIHRPRTKFLDFVNILQEELLRAGVLPADYDFEAHKELVPMQPGDVPTTYADATALERDFGLTPKITLREGLRIFAEWYKSYYCS